jgi:hypothetical protein
MAVPCVDGRQSPVRCNFSDMERIGQYDWLSNSSDSVTGGPVLLSAASDTAISLTGSGSTYNGLLVADGAATFTDSNTTLTCGVIARNMIITGSRATVTSC